jgi:hypothetical protein
MTSQLKALEELRLESEELYQAAIQVILFTSNLRVHFFHSPYSNDFFRNFRWTQIWCHLRSRALCTHLQLKAMMLPTVTMWMFLKIGTRCQSLVDNLPKTENIANLFEEACGVLASIAGVP